MDVELSPEITEKMLSGITLPPCPEVLVAVMDRMKDPDVDIAEVAQIIQQDAGMVAPLLKLINSPYLGLNHKVTSVMEAISVIGLKSTLILLQHVALKHSLAEKQPNFEKFWERSSLAASVASRLAGGIPGVSPDDAYIAALFHDCGIPILMQKYPDYPETVAAQRKYGRKIPEVEDEFYSTSHAVVGSLLSRNWFLPGHICKAILHHHEETIFSAPGNDASVAALNLIALIHMAECVVDEFHHEKCEEWHSLKRQILAFLDMAEQEFLELKNDALDLLHA